MSSKRPVLKEEYLKSHTNEVKIHSYKKILEELWTALEILISAGNGAFRQTVILTKYSTFASSFYIFTWAKKLTILTF